MPAPSILSPKLIVPVITRWFSTYLDVLGREWDRTWTEMREGFPNPLYVGVAFFGFFTSIPFLPLLAFMENFGRSMLPRATYYRRFVITGYDAFKLCTEVTARAASKASLIDNTFFEGIVIWLASRIWRSLSGGGLIARIRALVGLKSYEDVLKLVRNTVTKNIALQLARWFMVWFALGYGMITLVALGLYWDDWFKGLQQNNPRAYGKQRNRIRKKASR